MAVRKSFAFVMPDVRVGPGLERGASLRMPLEVAFAERKDAYTRCLARAWWPAVGAPP